MYRHFGFHFKYYLEAGGQKYVFEHFDMTKENTIKGRLCGDRVTGCVV